MLKLEHYFLKIITKKKRGAFAALLRMLLLLMSWPFQGIVFCRNWLFDRGWLRRYSPPVPVVISIGNIVAGGTGKTPVTLMIAQQFYEEFLIAILARGYRSKCEKLSAPTVLSYGEGPKRSPEFCGDEPYLIASALPKAFVIVGKDRHKASDVAAKFGAELLFLDDGMQHRRLARDFEVVVMDGCDLFGQGYFLPRGLLREGVNSLKRADLIIVNHAANQMLFEEARQRLEKHSQALIIGTQFQVDQIQLFHGQFGDLRQTSCAEVNASCSQSVASLAIPSLKNLKVGIFCGIARPEHFRNTVVEQGAIVVEQVVAADHMRIERKALRAFALRCKVQGAELLLCTEKDRVKLIEYEDFPLPIAYVKMRLSIVEGAEKWSLFIEKIKSRAHGC